MDIFGRLSDYDVFAYIPQGALALAAIDYVVGTNILTSMDWTIFEGSIFVILSYVAGHLISSLASGILERGVVRIASLQPSKLLLQSRRPSLLRRLILGSYTTAMHEPLRSDAIIRLGGLDVESATDEQIFWRAYPLASRDEKTAARLASFLNLYSFCRNLSFVFGAVAASMTAKLLISRTQVDPSSEEASWVIAICTIAGVMLFYRYLKFYRLYSLEVLKCFAVLAPIPPARLDKAEG